MPRYVFKDGRVVLLDPDSADPQKIGEALDKARRKTPPGEDMRLRVLEEARKDKRHPIHRQIEWDDKSAAHAYRLHQVNDLIASIHVYINEEDDEQGTVAAFISLSTDNSRRAFYSPSEIIGSLDLQIATLRRAERELEVWTRRYRMLGALCEDVTEARRKIAARAAVMEEGRRGGV